MLAVENFPEASRESLKVGEGVLRPANNTNKIADEAHRLPALLLPPLPGLVSEAARGPPDAVAESDIDNGDILFFGDRLHKLGKAGQGCTSLRLRGAEGEGPSTTTTTRRPRRALEAEPRLLGAKRWTWTPRGSVPDSYPPMPDGPSTPDRPEKASSIPFGEGLVDSHPQLKPPLSKRLAKNARSSWGSATAGIFKAFLAGEDSPARPRTPSPAIGREFTADLPSDGSNINVVGRRLKKCATWAAASEFEELLRDGPGASAAPAGPIEPHGRGVRTASSRFNRDKTPSKLRRGWLFPGRQLPDDDSDDFPNMPVRIGSDWVQFQPVAGLDQVSKAYYQQPRNPSPERAVESRRARYTYTTPRFPVKFHGPLLAMFEDGLVTSPKSCNDLEWKVFMGFCPSWPNSTAENTGRHCFEIFHAMFSADEESTTRDNNDNKPCGGDCRVSDLLAGSDYRCTEGKAGFRGSEPFFHEGKGAAVDVGGSVLPLGSHHEHNCKRP